MTEAETVKLLAVGGPRHGDEIEVAADAGSWVDLMTAETYFRSSFSFVAHDPRNPHSVSLRKAYQAGALVHESIAADRLMANQWWQALALTRLFAAVGEEVPLGEVMPRHEQTAPGANGATGMN